MNETHNHDSFSSDEQLEELLALYALGGLDAAEIEMIEEVLATDTEAENLLADYLDTTAALAFDVEPLAPATTTTADLLTRVEADAQARFGVKSMEPHTFSAPPQQHAAAPTLQQPATVSPGRGAAAPSLWEKISGLFQAPAFAGLALTTAAVALIWSVYMTGQLQSMRSQVGDLSAQNTALLSQQGELEGLLTNLQLESERMTENVALLTSENDELSLANATLETTNQLLSDDIVTLAADKDELQVALVEANSAANELLAERTALNTQLEEQSGILSLFNSPAAQAYTIPGTLEQPQAEGQIIVDPNNHHAILIVNGMQPLAEGLVYQVLLIRGSEHDTAETFEVDTQGQTILLVSSDKPLQTFDAVGVSVEPEGGSSQRTGEVILLGGIAN